MNAALVALLIAPLDKVALEKAVDDIVKSSLDRGDAPGAVVLVLQRDEVVLRKAYGSRVLTPEKIPMTADAVFDLASLTKPVTTAASVLKLVEMGKLRLDDPASKHWPAFAAEGKDVITIEHLLTHVGGLIADNAIADYADGKAKALERVAALVPKWKPGERFVYSDVGFIVLGEVVGRVGRKPLPDFAKEHLFDPLKLADTMYLPKSKLGARIAPTTKVGDVHDPRAAAMGGVAGHAGLFGTADDLGRFARMLLNGGELDSVRVFKPETVKLFTEPVKVPGGFRSRGWDVDTSFSAPRGDAFAKGTGFGHTGFTGTSIWVDPDSKTVVIVLTSRLHPDGKGNVTRLRREVGTAVGNAVK